MSKTGKKRRAVKIILPILVIVAAVLAFKMLGNLKPTPQRHATHDQGLLVEVTSLQATSHRVTVYATGTVAASQQINLTPQVGGQVSWISQRLVAGGTFWKGDLLLRIDSRDYELAIEQAKAEVAQAQVALASEQEQARISQAEWDSIQFPGKGEPGPLVTHALQLKQQKAILAAAEASLEKAQLNLQRTEIRAPFNGRIRSEQVDIGQYLPTGSTIAVFAGTDYAEIEVPLPLADLHWLQVPRSNDERGSQVTVNAPQFTSSSWRGHISRALGEIDATSRMAQLIVQVKNPYQLNKNNPGPILSHGLFVELELEGKTLENVMIIPRSALHTGNMIWLADKNNRLVTRQVDILRREKEQLIIKNVISANERLILTSLSGAADGALLRPVAVQEAH